MSYTTFKKGCMAKFKSLEELKSLGYVEDIILKFAGKWVTLEDQLNFAKNNKYMNYYTINEKSWTDVAEFSFSEDVFSYFVYASKFHKAEFSFSEDVFSYFVDASKFHKYEIVYVSSQKRKDLGLLDRPVHIQQPILEFENGDWVWYYTLQEDCGLSKWEENQLLTEKEFEEMKKMEEKEKELTRPMPEIHGPNSDWRSDQVLVTDFENDMREKERDLKMTYLGICSYHAIGDFKKSAEALRALVAEYRFYISTLLDDFPENERIKNLSRLTDTLNGLADDINNTGIRHQNTIYEIMNYSTNEEDDY